MGRLVVKRFSKKAFVAWFSFIVVAAHLGCHESNASEPDEPASGAQPGTSDQKTEVASLAEFVVPLKYSSDLEHWGVAWDCRGRWRFLEKQRPPQISVEPRKTGADRTYGVVSFGEKHRLGVIVDTLQERSTSIVVDANGNGDLTDDKRRTGREHVVELRLNGAYPYAVSICVAWMGSADREGPSIRWGRACLMHGLLKVAGTAYAIALEDATDDGTYDFHQHDYGEDVYSGDRLLVDTNANGRIDGMIEARDVRHPFFIKGRAFQVTHIQPNGEFLRVREQETRTVLLSAHDSRNAEPLTGVTMTVYPGWHVVTTDHDGSVRLQVPQGDYHVIAQRDRHIPEYQRLVVGPQDGGTEQLCEFSLVEWQRLKGTVSLRPGEAYKFFSGKTVHYDEPMSHDPAKSIEIARESDLAYRIHRGDHYVDAIGRRRLIRLGETAQRMPPGSIFDGRRSCPVAERHSYALCLSEYTRPDVFESTYSISHYIVFDVLEANDDRLRIRWEFANRPSPDAELTWPARIDQGVPDVGEAEQ